MRAKCEDISNNLTEQVYTLPSCQSVGHYKLDVRRTHTYKFEEEKRHLFAMANALSLDSLSLEWTGVSPCAGTNGSMTVGEEATVGAEATRPVEAVEPMESEDNGQLMPVAREEPTHGRDPEFTSILGYTLQHQEAEVERVNSVRCIRAAANAAVAVSGFLRITEGGDPLVNCMNVLARVLNSYRDCSAKTTYELQKDVNTRGEARRREAQAEQCFAYFNTGGEYFGGTILVEGSGDHVFDVRREYAEMRDTVYGDLTDCDTESEDEAVPGPVSAAMG